MANDLVDSDASKTAYHDISELGKYNLKVKTHNREGLQNHICSKAIIKC